MRIQSVIIAGGLSVRMGSDKVNLIWQGQTLLRRIAGEALKASSPIMIVGRERPPGWDLDGCEFFSDDLPGLGPLGGLLTALQHTECDGVAALACDMPLLTVSGIEWLLQAAAGIADDKNGLATMNADKIEPLYSVYFSNCLPLIEKMLARGSRALYKLIEMGDFHHIRAPEFVVRQLVNMNTPEDWAKLTAGEQLVFEGVDNGN